MIAVFNTIGGIIMRKEVSLSVAALLLGTGFMVSNVSADGTSQATATKVLTLANPTAYYNISVNEAKQYINQVDSSAIQRVQNSTSQYRQSQLNSTSDLNHLLSALRNIENNDQAPVQVRGYLGPIDAALSSIGSQSRQAKSNALNQLNQLFGTTTTNVQNKNAAPTLTKVSAAKSNTMSWRFEKNSTLVSVNINQPTTVNIIGGQHSTITYAVYTLKNHQFIKTQTFSSVGPRQVKLSAGQRLDISAKTAQANGDRYTVTMPYISKTFDVKSTQSQPSVTNKPTTSTVKKANQAQPNKKPAIKTTPKASTMSWKVQHNVTTVSVNANQATTVKITGAQHSTLTYKLYTNKNGKITQTSTFSSRGPRQINLTTGQRLDIFAQTQYRSDHYTITMPYVTRTFQVKK